MIKKYYRLLLIFGFFVFVYLLTFYAPANPDTWFHLASGKVIAQNGIVHYDFLSQAGQLRTWVPYEWLFQIVLYLLTSVFGVGVIRVLVGLGAVVHIGIFYLFLRRVLRVGYFFSLSVSVFYFLLVSSMFVARPQIIASTFFIAEIYIVLLFFLRNKNMLFLLLPLTYLWANMHGSVILSVFYLLAYCFVAGGMYWYTRNTDWLQKAKILGIYVVGVSVVSVLPPQFLMQYQYVLLLFHNMTLISQNIKEWLPLTVFAADTLMYSLVIVIPFTAFVYVVWKKKIVSQIIWMTPLLILLPYGYFALRNTYFGYFVASVIVGWLLEQIKIVRYRLPALLLVGLGMVCIYTFLIYATFNRMQNATTDFPEKAATFIKNENLKGNMFNQYAYGGYLEYQLYPKYKVFIDGRTDVFLCCELPGYTVLQSSVSFPDDQYDALVNRYFEINKISYVVLEVKNDAFGAKVSNVLLKDSKWSLVYWDDGYDIFVKHDAKNNDVLRKFTATVATPFAASPFKNGNAPKAYNEYARMIQVADSAVSRNALGYILFMQGNLSQAKIEFQKAIVLDSTYESGYSNLAEVMVREQNYEDALSLYTKALSLNLNRPIIYIRLGQLYHTLHNDEKAREIWQQGLEHIQDAGYKQVINQYLQLLPN